jgi:cell division protease FtsH
MVQLAPRENRYLGLSGSFGADKPFSEATAQRIDSEVQRIISECQAEARRLLALHRPQLDALVAALLAHETLGQEEILKVTGLPPAPELENRPLPPVAPSS